MTTQSFTVGHRKQAETFLLDSEVANYLRQQYRSFRLAGRSRAFSRVHVDRIYVATIAAMQRSADYYQQEV